MICPNCESKNREIARYCKRCGIWLRSQCPFCGSELPEGSVFCDQCGRRLGEEEYRGSASGSERTAPRIHSQPIPQTPPSTGQRQPELEEIRRSGAEMSPASISHPDFHLQRYIPHELLNKIESARASDTMVGERRVVTMLFCDVVGSTASAEQLDPEDWTDIINGAFEFMIKPVYKYEGTVARLMGDAILAFFGAPITHEDDPQRAVLAGLDIVNSIQSYRESVRERWGVDFDVRVGINTGRVVVGAVGSDLRMEYTAMGDAINLAARMEQTAQPGSVQIAEPTYRVVAPLFEVKKIEEVTLKGKVEPISAYRVLQRKEEAGRLRGIEGLDAPLIGRASEWSRLINAWESLQQGVGGIVFLIGEAGLGKSRLIRELKAKSSENTPDLQPVNWRETTSLSYEKEQPYGMFQRLIRRMIDTTQGDPPDILREKIRAIASFPDMSPAESEQTRQVFESLFGLPGPDGAPPLEGETFKGLLFSAVRSLVRRLAGDTRLVLVFDDLHWADPASIALLAHLYPLTNEVPLLLLCATRPERSSPGWKLKKLTADEYSHRYSEINVRPLSNEDSDELVNNLLTIADLPKRMRARILEKSEGNPFFVEEVVRTLIETGAVVRESQPGSSSDSNYWRAAKDIAKIEIPDNLQALLIARIDKLEEETRRTLQLAALIGRSFYYRVLAQITNGRDQRPGSHLEQQLDKLQRVDLIREVARMPELEYAFRHALTQEATYQTVLRKQRVEYHRRVGEALERLYPEQVEEHAPMLAHHFHEGQEYERALKYYTLAGDLAYRLYANVEAVTHYSRAIEIASRLDVPGEQWTHLYINRGRALEIIHDYDKALANYEALDTLAEEKDDQALKLAALTACTVIHNTFTPKFDPQRGKRLSEQAMELARRLKDKESEAKILWSLMLAYGYGALDFHNAIRFGEKSLVLVRDYELQEQLAITLNDLGRMLGLSGQIRRGLKMIAEAHPLLVKMGNLPIVCDNRSGNGLLNIFAGDFEAALESAAEGFRISQNIDSFYGMRDSKWMMQIIDIEQGKLGKAIEGFNDLIQKSQQAGTHSANLYPYLGIAYATLGAVDPIIEKMKAKASEAGEAGIFFENSFFAQLARLYLLRGDIQNAKKAFEQCQFDPEETIPSPMNLWIFFAEIELTLLDGEIEIGLDKTNRIIETMKTWGLRYWLPDIYLLKGKALLKLQPPEVEKARETLTEARAVAEETGAKRLLWEILALLAEIEDQLENPRTAEEHRNQAREIVHFIAEGLNSEELRDSFMKRPDVAKLFKQGTL